ncbi:alpha-E domain-containing protein [Paenibacillus sp. LHD-117]|uniref:alpha-E domain-containing protein n=1 Tax=Paenibacillus sp. LHD-117 TaxID=3071412 RepID=UPI0027E16571|nr:alpha-E domain-containing protein [Paenibacillus sp. LHD-117]MDQ6419955.1 alpha-E domain-containing protein [Paenibacillus sp. LHD-117]
MLNRNAEALFWIGRYMERAENHARLVDVHYHLQIDKEAAFGEETDEASDAEAFAKWARIVDALGSRDAYEGQYGAYTEKDVLYYTTLDRDNPNSLISCVSYARGNVRTLREKLPSELWDVVNGCYLWLREKRPDEVLGESPHQFYARIKEWTSLFLGVSMSVMPRENEWHFIECGRYLERAENTLRIIRSAGQTVNQEKWDAAGSYPYLQAVLRSVSGYQPFRRYYADGITLQAIMEFVVLNNVFPRSLQFALHMLDESLCRIDLQDKSLRIEHERMIRQIGKVKADIACLEREDLAIDSEGMIITHLLKATQQLGTVFAKTFFRMGEASA